MVKHGHHFMFTEDAWLGDYVVTVGGDIGEPVVNVTGVLVQYLSGIFLVTYLEVFNRENKKMGLKQRTQG